MKTNNQHPERFTNAVVKLYNAFHKNQLIAMDCDKCAVGNLCDNDGEWKQAGGIIPEAYSKHTGYSSVELGNIEYLFMYGTKRSKHAYPVWFASDNRKETQFKGLCAVVEYLCELDNIPNIMDYTKLFETENNEPKYQLS